MEAFQFDQFWQSHRNHYFSIEKKAREQHQQNIHDTGLESTWKSTHSPWIFCGTRYEISTLCLPWGAHFRLVVVWSWMPPNTGAHFWLSVFQKESSLCTQSILQHNTKHGKQELPSNLLQKHSSSWPKNADVETSSDFFFFFSNFYL